MKAATGLLVLASTALSAAQVTKNGNGTYTCALSSGSYCASASLQGNTIIRCVNGVGTISSCDARLASKSPVGESYSPCWQTSTISGNAACSKDGIIYPDGNNTTPYPVPNYQYESASIASAATATTGTTSWPYVNLTTTRLTSTRTNYHTVYATVATAGAFVNTTAPYNNSTANAVAAYIPAAVSPMSTVYVTDVVYSYTTTCPAGVTVTNAAGSETVLATPSTITLTGTSQSTVTAIASVVVAPAQKSAAAAAASVDTLVSSPVEVVESAAAASTVQTESAAVASAVFAATNTPVAVQAPYTFSNVSAVYTNATTLAVVASTAPSASASAGYGYNTTVLPFTGSASSISASGALSVAVGMALLFL